MSEKVTTYFLALLILLKTSPVHSITLYWLLNVTNISMISSTIINRGATPSEFTPLRLPDIVTEVKRAILSNMIFRLLFFCRFQFFFFFFSIFQLPHRLPNDLTLRILEKY